MPLLPVLFSRYALVGYAVAAVLLVAGLGVLRYGEQREHQGVLKERAVWVKKYSRAQARAAEAERQLAAANVRLNEAIRQRDAARRRALAQTETEIANAPDFETRYSAYLQLRNSLRDAASQRHARAWADYMSSVTGDSDGRTVGAGPELRGEPV